MDFLRSYWFTSKEIPLTEVGNTPLHLGDPFADYNTMTNLAGESPLHTLVRKDSILVTDTLDKGANPNAKDLLGRTPLHLAYIFSPSWINILIETGAKDDIKDKYGKVPADYY